MRSRMQVEAEKMDQMVRMKQEREVVAQSMVLEKRDKEFEKVKTIDMMNRSLEVEQLKLMKQF